MPATVRTTSPRPRAALAALAALASLALVVAALAACSSGASTGSSAIAVTDAWVRVPMNAAGPAGAYMTIGNTGSEDDALLSASSPLAGSVEIHETMTDASGMTGMSPVEKIAVPAGKGATLAPGGYHMMLMGLTKQLAVGDKVELDLVFEKAGKVTVQADVRGG